MGKLDVIAALQAQINSMESAGPLRESPVGTFNPRLGESALPSEGEAGASSPWEDRPTDDSLPAKDGNAAFKKVVLLVNVRDRSEREVRERLGKEGFGPQAVDFAMGRALQCGFVDDMRFADVLVRSRVSQGKGSAGIVRELAGHDIDAEELPGWPFEYGISPEEELDRAMGILRRNPPRSKNKRDSAYRKIVSKGYPSSIASSAARMWAESIQ